ncbi:MAG: DUF898 domain-containing protein [Candidatus Dadabacteria bacterium]|nr:DUF898 domain-containing protein [Candidatus Dadabacteria bacterium]
MKCPNCNSSVPNSWNICRCGYNLLSSAPVQTPIYKKNVEAAKKIEKNREFLKRSSKQQAGMGDKTQVTAANRPTGDATQIIETESLVQKQKAEMLKASEARRRQNVGDDTTQILNVSDAPIEMANPNISIESEQAPDSRQAAQGDMEGGKIGEVELSAESGSSNKFNFRGKGSTYFGIFIINILLTIVTFLIYYFWAKIKERRYLYNQTEFDGDSFNYHATGLELLFAWLKVIPFVLIVIGIQYLEILYPGDATRFIVGITIYLIIVLVTPIALVLTQRFRYSRTSWRGIRFSFRGKIKEFMRIYVPGLILISLTFGIYYYYLHFQTRDYHINHTYFGDTKFGFDGKSSDLFKKFLLAIVLSLFTFGIYWFWFAAERHRYYWSHTYFKNIRFRSTIQGRPLLWLKLTNLLLIVFTLGLGYPYAVIRETRFIFDNLYLDGELDFQAIMQDAKSPSAVGEGIADAFDIDLVGMDLGI